MLKNKWETMFPVRMKKSEQKNRNYKKEKNRNSIFRTFKNSLKEQKGRLEMPVNVQIK